MNMGRLKRRYHRSDAELALFAKKLESFMTRDALEFAARGIDAADIAALAAKREAFEAYPTDAEYRGLRTVAREDKSVARKALLDAVRNISDRALLKWGAASIKYNSFGVKGLVRFRDIDLLFTSRRTARLGTKYLTELADEGLTQTMIDDLTAFADEFEEKMHAVRDAAAERDLVTRERITAANELSALTGEYCEAGKTIWKYVSEAKYNDYVIYSDGGGKQS